jgi:hypothetical protein
MKFFPKIKTTANSSHPLFGHRSQNEILFHKKYLSTFDKLVVTNPVQRVAAIR